MKRLIEEVSNDGLESLIGERVVVWCVNYIYTGKLIGANETDVLITDASVVYETGDLCADEFADSQPLPNDWYIRTTAIESYGKAK